MLSIKNAEIKNSALNSFEWYGHNTISENCRQFSKFTNEKLLLTKQLIQILSPNHGDSVLDIGCGEGHLLKELSKTVKQSMGIEPDPEMIKLAKNNLKGTNSQLIQTTFENFGIEQKFTIVIASHVFSFFRDKEAIVNKIIDLTKKNGKITMILHSSKDDQLQLLSQVNSQLGRSCDHMTAEDMFSYLEKRGLKPKLEKLETKITFHNFDDVLKMSYFLFRIKPTEINSTLSQILRNLINNYQKNKEITLSTTHGIISLFKPY